MNANDRETALKLMDERFGHDTLISLATCENNIPSVRTVNSFYENGSFYVITYALSNKMTQIAANPSAAVCGDWFTAHGTAENLGWVLREENAELICKLRSAFAAWYDKGHTDESDENTVILRIKLTDGLLAHHGTWYDIDFTLLEK